MSHLGRTSSLEDSFSALEADLLPVLPPIPSGNANEAGQRGALKGSGVPRRVKSADDRSNRESNSNAAHASERERRSLSGVRDPYFDSAESCTLLENASDCTLLEDPPGAEGPGRGGLPWASSGVPQAGQPPPSAAGAMNSTSNNNVNYNDSSTAALRNALVQQRCTGRL